MSLEELTSMLTETYQEMVQSLDELWKNTQNLFIEKMSEFVDECNSNFNELQDLRKQSRGDFSGIDQAFEIFDELKNTLNN